MVQSATRMPNKGCVSLARLIAFAVHVPSVQANFSGTSCGVHFFMDYAAAQIEFSGPMLYLMHSF